MRAAKRGRVLGITLTDDGVYDECTEHEIAIENWPLVWLRAEVAHACLQFSASADGERWQAVGPVLDASKLSNDYGSGLHFTSAFVGLCAQDLGGTRIGADFDYFAVQSENEEVV